MIPVQSTGTFTSSLVASINVAFANPVTAGNLLVCVAGDWSNNNRTFTVSDNVNAGNWIQAVATVAGGGGANSMGIFFKSNTGAGTPTVTVAVNTNDTIGMIIEEWPITVVSPLDQISATNGNGSTASATAATTGATTQAIELVIGGLCNAQARTITAAGAYTLDQVQNSRVAAVYLTTATTGIQTAAFNLVSGGTWNCQCATFLTVPPLIERGATWLSNLSPSLVSPSGPLQFWSNPGSGIGLQPGGFPFPVSNGPNPGGGLIGTDGLSGPQVSRLPKVNIPPWGVSGPGVTRDTSVSRDTR